MLGTDLEEANYVHASDLNGDGHVDILSATMRGDRIVWWQNPGGPGTWTEHTVDDDYEGPYTVISADLDADGDQDLAVAAIFGSRVSWFENVTGNALTWVEHTVGLDFDFGRSVRVADLDGDGDLDLAASASNGDRFSWWQQQGGQYALPTSDAVVSATPDEGGTDLTLLQITARHLGRAGDDALEMHSFRLRLETASGAPMTPAETIDTLSTIRVHRDDGDGVFSAAADPVAIVVEPVVTPTVEGEITLAFLKDDAAAEVAYGSDVIFFVTADLKPTASLVAVGGFRAVHLAEASRAAMSETGLLLALEPQTPVASTVMIPQSASVLVATPEILDFGQRGIDEGPGIPRAVTIENQGTASFDVGSVRLLGLDNTHFSIVGDTGETVLSTGAVRIFSIAFDPISMGARAARLVIFRSGGVGEAVGVELTGVGTEAFFSDGFESGDPSAWPVSSP